MATLVDYRLGTSKVNITDQFGNDFKEKPWIEVVNINSRQFDEYKQKRAKYNEDKQIQLEEKAFKKVGNYDSKEFDKELQILVRKELRKENSYENQLKNQAESVACCVVGWDTKFFGDFNKEAVLELFMDPEFAYIKDQVTIHVAALENFSKTPKKKAK